MLETSQEPMIGRDQTVRRDVQGDQRPAEFLVLSGCARFLSAPPPSGRVVFSNLAPGRSNILTNSSSVKVVLEGEHSYEVDGTRLQVRAGQYIYVEAGATCFSTNREHATGVCVTLPSQEQGLVSGQESSDQLFSRSVVMSCQTTGFGRALLALGTAIGRTKEVPRSSEMVIREVAHHLATALDECNVSIRALSALKASKRHELFQRLERAREYMHGATTRSVTLDELAIVAGLSKYHLARQFKLAFGTPPLAYHRRLRIEYAIRLMNSSISLDEAAELVGYSDQTALSHAVRSQFGLSPRRAARDLRLDWRDRSPPPRLA